jgi:ribosomal protein L7Ae-like RNA K-turn-binding protein
MTEPTPSQPVEPVQPVESVESSHPVERLFPFVLKTRSLVAGRNALRANKGKLHFVLIATDIGEANRDEVLDDFKHYPVVQHFTAADLEKFFNVQGAKAVGFRKSGLAQSIYAELKAHRINQPFVPPKARPELPGRNSA